MYIKVQCSIDKTRKYFKRDIVVLRLVLCVFLLLLLTWVRLGRDKADRNDVILDFMYFHLPPTRFL